MNNKFKGIYDTEGTSFISDKVEPINYYEPTIKTAKIQNHTYSINFDKTELYKEIERLQQELQRKDNIIKDIKEFIEFHYTDNIEFYKNKGIGLDYPQVDYILNKIEELEDNK